MSKLLKIFLIGSLVMFGINTYGEESNLTIIKAEPMYSKKIVLTFNSALESDNSAVRDFKIVNKGDDLDVINIVKNKLISNEKIELEVEKDLSVSTEYEINVISIKDDKGNSITKGINGIIAFKTPSKFPVENLETNTGSSTVSIKEEIKQDEITEKTPVVTEDKKDEILMSSASKEESNNSITNTVVVESKNTENLPKTGPEEILLILGSLILGLFILKKKKA